MTHARVDGRQQSARLQWTVFALVAVILTDQATKWWAWREVPHARINFGGDPLVSPAVDRWYAGPVSGAVLDFLGAVVLVLAVFAFLRRRHPVVLRASAALAIGGWISNLLDRLGMHRLTAPGSVRGAVDFVPIGRYYFNVADFFIIGATLVFVGARIYRWATTSLPAVRPEKTGTPATMRLPARMGAVTGLTALVVAVTLGAAHYGGVTVPPQLDHSTRVPATTS
ncbi:signal peptidase II [Actinocrispum sp. NPDC049592]|uniref:signal peptidase II n=1 Tax=Actinocrispum sp. NPDC049592 TaxID=3154835 RepID=UPI003433D68F